MSGRRRCALPLLAVAGTAALLTVTACGSAVDTPGPVSREGNADSAASASASGGKAGRFKVKCLAIFVEGTPPPSVETACPKEPTKPAKPTPTVTMTPRLDPTRSWGGPTCGPRDEWGVTRHGSLLKCSPNGEGHGEWVWPPGPAEGEPCVDEGEWVIRTPARSMVCRDGTWLRKSLVTPSATPTPSETPRLMPCLAAHVDSRHCEDR